MGMVTGFWLAFTYGAGPAPAPTGNSSRPTSETSAMGARAATVARACPREGFAVMRTSPSRPPSRVEGTGWVAAAGHPDRWTGRGLTPSTRGDGLRLGADRGQRGARRDGGRQLDQATALGG